MILILLIGNSLGATILGFKTIKKNSTSNMVIEQIKNEIIEGNLKPGEKIPTERELAKILGVSRTSIREAINALSYSGYLESMQGKGTFVTENAKKYDEISELLSNVSDYSLSSLMEVREMLEGEFVKLATMRATDEEMREIVKEYNAEFVREDLNFHLYIANVTHNPLMNTLMKVFGAMLHRETNQITQESVRTKEKTIEITGRLVEAMMNREADKAKELMLEHIRLVKKAVE